MEFFIDTADIEEIKTLYAGGLVDGVTTNPSLVAQSGRNFLELVKEVASIVMGPVSAEVASTDYATMKKEADVLAGLSKHVVIKLPLTPDGLRLCKELNERGIMTNVTLCFSAAQALLAAKAGATYISPFIGRLDDVGQDGMQLIHEIVAIYNNYPNIKTKILAASIRHPVHVVQAAMAGAHVATIPPKILRQLFNHPLTDKGLATFTADWQKTGQSIL